MQDDTDVTHCQGCGVELPPRTRKHGQARKWCSESCARQHRTPKPAYATHCVRCGDELPTSPPRHRKWCSSTCARANEKQTQRQKLKLKPRPKRTLYCQRCGDELPEGSRPHRKWCSAKCAQTKVKLAVVYWKPVPLRRWFGGFCSECAEPFVSKQPQGKYCSARCAKRNGERIKWQRRRARKLSNGESEHIDLRQIAERDDWTCHLCRRIVTRKTWSIDHLVPLVHGGTHTCTNVALAHRLCNAVRGDLPLKETQLMLDATRAALEDAA